MIIVLNLSTDIDNNYRTKHFLFCCAHKQKKFFLQTIEKCEEFKM